MSYILALILYIYHIFSNHCYIKKKGNQKITKLKPVSTMNNIDMYTGCTPIGIAAATFIGVPCIYFASNIAAAAINDNIVG